LTWEAAVKAFFSPWSDATAIRLYSVLLGMLILLFLSAHHPAAASSSSATFLGSEACRPCHIKEYESFVTYAKKSRSFESINRLRKGLTEEEIKRCYSCHTTGYGKPGGFVSQSKTPQLKNTGCEVCHGPGSLHATSGDKGAIKGKLVVEDCEACHVSDRVQAFRFKPLIHGGAH